MPINENNIETKLKLLESYKSNEEDFKEFINQLKILFERNKSAFNLNNKESFIKVVNASLNLEDSKTQEEFISKSKFKHFVNVLNDLEIINTDSIKAFEQDFISFNALKVEIPQNLQKQSFKQELLEDIMQELEENAPLSQESTNAQNALQEAKVMQQNSFLSPKQRENLESFTAKPEIKPEELIAYIKDKEHLLYPFKYEQTLGDKKFVQNFYKTLSKYDTKELENLLSAIKDKNARLREEIANMQQDRKEILGGIEKGLQENAFLSNVKEEKQQIPQMASEQKSEQNDALAEAINAQEQVQKQESNSHKRIRK